MARGNPGEEIEGQGVQANDALPRKLNPEVRNGPTPANALGDISAAQTQKYQADSATWAGNALSDFRQQAVAKLDQAKSQVQGDPVNFTQNYLTQFDKDAAPLAAQAAKNPAAAPIMEHGLRTLRDTLQDHTMQWEATQGVAFRQDSITQQVEKQLPLIRQHPELAESVGATVMSNINAMGGDPSVRLKFARAADQQISSAAAAGVVDQNPTEAWRQLSSGNVTDTRLSAVTDPAARAGLTATAEKGMIEEYAHGAIASYRTGGPKAGAAVYAGVDNLPVSDDIKDKMRESIQEGRSKLIAEQQQKLAPVVMDLQQQLSSGKVKPGAEAEVWNLYNGNALAAEHAGSMLGEITRIRNKAVDDGSGIQTIEDAFAGKVRLDPKDKTQMNDLYNWFNDKTDRLGIQQGSPAWVNFAADVAHKTGAIPGPVGDWTRATLVSPTASNESLLSAADAVDRMRSAAPLSYRYLDDDSSLARMADAIMDAKRAGVPAQLAVEQARKLQSMGPAEKKELEEKWRTFAPFGKSDDAIEGVLRQEVKNQPGLQGDHELAGFHYSSMPSTLPAAMQAEYGQLTRRYFNTNGGNLGPALDAAARDVGTVWGVTGVNGDPEITKYPIERMFKDDEGRAIFSPKDIRSDLNSQVGSNPEHFQKWDPVKGALAPFKPGDDDLKLVPIPQTETSGGVRWGVVYHNPDTDVTESVFGPRGEPLTYDVPVKGGQYMDMRRLNDVKAEAEAAERRKENDAAYEDDRRVLEGEQSLLRHRM